MANHRHILLITSTIAPSKDTFQLVVLDAEERFRQYLSAFRFYVSLLATGTFDKIVYMDNSGYPLDALEKVARESGVAHRVEFLSCVQGFPGKNSRYFLEMKLIDRAMAESKFLNLDQQAIIWKVTGRYIIRNAAALVASWSKGVDLYLHHRNVPHPVIDFYFFGFVRWSYDRHIGAGIEQFEGVEYGEMILRRRIDGGDFGRVRIQKRFKVTPRLEGTRGIDGSSYSGPAYLSRYLVRKIANVLVPNWWI
ncbi:hypothetical protein [Fuscovulum ytuae]|uniref:Glycosyltransferase family 2 protein n=1 Tax=Fuscovulum ytuae TaxID=3042299 RepID=A0ABY8Q6M5_9RHOB|nr:hypothetical protein [Fuscovulum sp. YMD61]WGV15930.1 hypothetical protein QF092_17015 [Fuscovulum sp. YMD61]